MWKEIELHLLLRKHGIDVSCIQFPGWLLLKFMQKRCKIETSNAVATWRELSLSLSLSLSLRPCISRQVKSPSPPWFHKQGIPVTEMAALLPGDENSLPPPVTKERKQEKRKNPISVSASRTSSTDAWGDAEQQSNQWTIKKPENIHDEKRSQVSIRQKAIRIKL